jgi:hypothetical protein
MPDKSIIHMQDRQRRVFRIACDPARYGLTLKLIAIDAGLGYDSVRHYASGETVMPMTAFVALVGVIPDELLSLLLPDGRLLIRAPEGMDHDDFSKCCLDYTAAKEAAHHPESEAGREIGPGEDETLRGKAAKLRLVA